MRKLYNKFFYVPKYGKISEKVMLVRVAMTIVVMVMCLAAIGITAYAYFSHNVTSNTNIIKAANFEANASINGETVTTTKSGKLQTVNLEEAGIYTIELTKDESTASTGFCIITINNTDYFTQQIGNDVERGLTDGSASVVFTLKVSSATKIEILSHWGTSKYYGYTDEGRPEIFIDSTGFFLDLTNDEADNSDGQDGSGTTTDTTPPPTTDTTTEPTVTEPTVTEPTVTEPTVTEPTVTEPTVTEPTVTEPTATEPTATEPTVTEPTVTEPTATEPTATEPTVTEPTVTEPTVTEPTVTEPAATEPTVTEPAATEPTVTEPTATEPAATESTDTTESTETQPTTETTEPTGTPTTEAGE